ncbi:copper resistance protein CopC [Pseudoglutamicibacter cumminsii]|uniref:copper resistance CopC family protein n=1 Tax=Pseudoglutamicibacter cumminsii TaxID=156979 RepID=UPI002554BD58|nr:copper resistance CopC family protein [Pseudoglutamicibacter cumminsii]MDK7083494.1 copper resistance protein CopC [Pseudoglutamicibacter cumminsii]
MGFGVRMSRRVVVVLAAAMLLFSGMFAGFGAQNAFAHDQLIAGDPPSGNAIQKAPKKITLTFSGEIKQVAGGEANQIVVVDRDGNEFTHGDITIKGTKVSRDLKPLPAGTYDVQWSALSSDGHRIQGDGNYSFTITEGASKKEVGAWEKKHGEGSSEEPSNSDGAGQGSEGSEGTGADASSQAQASGSSDAQEGSVIPESTADTTTIMWIVGAAFVVVFLIGLILQLTRKKSAHQRH